VTFSDGELGVPYKNQVEIQSNPPSDVEVIEKNFKQNIKVTSLKVITYHLSIFVWVGFELFLIL